MAKAKRATTETAAAAEAPKTVKVEALQWHTYNGKEYNVGDTYDIDEQYADSVATQGKAVRVDRVAKAKAAASDTESMRRRSTKGAKKKAVKSRR